MDYNLKAGLSGQAKSVVTESNTALEYGSGSVNVFATPAMIGLMEKAAIEAVDDLLPEGYASVGTSLKIRHLEATPIGINVIAEAKLIELDGPKLKFAVEAFDNAGKIGEGTHSRYIVKLSEFMKKAESKR